MNWWRRLRLRRVLKRSWREYYEIKADHERWGLSDELARSLEVFRQHLENSEALLVGKTPPYPGAEGIIAEEDVMETTAQAPPKDSFWSLRHGTGRFRVVVLADQDETVVYRSVITKQVYTMSVTDWAFTMARVPDSQVEMEAWLD